MNTLKSKFKSKLSTKLSVGFAFIAFVTVILITLSANILINKQFEEYVAEKQKNFSDEMPLSIEPQYNSETKEWNIDYIHGFGMYALNNGYIIKLYDNNKEIIWDASNHDMTLCHKTMQNISSRMKESRPSLDGEFSTHNYESLDDEPVKILFLIAAPDTKDNVHLDVLSKLSVLLMDENFVAKLMKAGSPEEFLEIIDGADEEAKSIDERLEKEDNKPAKILAVTSCPTGIAHTYMAAEGLEKAAAKAGCAIKIETRGSGGAKNVLTDADIESAECIIVAADAQVPMERFDGKKVIECQVSDGINKADELIKKALAGDAPIYKAGTSEKKESASAKKGGGIGHKIYTQLMNGVSHMLPFVVGGGILIAIAFLIDGLNVDMNALSEAERSNFGTITPVAALFKSIGGAAFGFMLPVLAGFIAMAIGDRPALALGFVGGYIAANGKSGFLGALDACSSSLLMLSLLYHRYNLSDDSKSSGLISYQLL